MLDRIRLVVEGMRSTLGADACWTWPQKARTVKGYAMVRDGHTRQAHRYVYEHLVAPVPEGMVLDHLCRNRACVNPAHMEPVTNRENVMRGLTPTANRTRCKQDLHELAAVGIYVDSYGFERCRACRQESKRRYAAKRAA